MVRRIAVRALRAALPPETFDRLRRRFGRSHPARMGKKVRYAGREGLAVFPLGEGAEMHVFWKVVAGIGSGPAFSIFVGEWELLRIDCFGPGAGHFHVAVPRDWAAREDRIWMIETDRTAQIDRALFEMTRNLRYYQERHPDRRVRMAALDPGRVAAAAGEAAGIAKGFLRTVPEIGDPAYEGPERVAAAG